MMAAGPVTTDIVLLGGGHAHVHVLTAFAMRPLSGARLTLVTRELETPYSGMLPGVIAGLYTREQAHIDLARLAAATGVRLIHAEAIGLDRKRKHVLLHERAPIAYDLLSIDVGITPALDAIAGAAEHAIAVKPIGLFLGKLARLLERIREVDGPRRIAVVGGGAGGVELLLSLRARLLREADEAGLRRDRFEFVLATDGDILQTHNVWVRAAFRRILHERRVRVLENARVAAVHDNAIALQDGRQIAADCVLVTIHAAAPAWLAGTGLSIDAEGFVAVGPTLQALNDPDVFAAGDCAALVETPREKAGVYAVRAGPPLARNLKRRARGEPLRPWRPQRRHLSLISSGERYAVASRGALKMEGAWLWTVKDWIDRRWMRMYQDVDRLLARMPKAPPVKTDVNAVEIMRCGGCGAKIGPGPLSRALARFGSQPAGDVVVGLDAREDAAVLAPPRGLSVQSVDFFRAFISDSYLFGEVAANHALNDIFAMGGTPRHALAIAVIPFGPAAKVEEELFQVLAGARACFDREQVALVGGHSSEGSELSIGFSVGGEASPGRIVRKGGLQTNDCLVLTKPLGTGIVFAAAMQAKAGARSIEHALVEMRRSNRVAAEILIRHGAHAMTDVTGFGLAGHLGEMLAASACSAALDLPTLPVYDGAMTLVRAGIRSTLLSENLALRNLIEGEVDADVLALLFDPQTAGGLVAGIPERNVMACVAALRTGGHRHASMIGRITRQGLLSRDVRIAVAGRLS